MVDFHAAARNSRSDCNFAKHSIASLFCGRFHRSIPCGNISASNGYDRPHHTIGGHSIRNRSFLRYIRISYDLRNRREVADVCAVYRPSVCSIDTAILAVYVFDACDFNRCSKALSHHEIGYLACGSLLCARAVSSSLYWFAAATFSVGLDPQLVDPH